MSALRRFPFVVTFAFVVAIGCSSGSGGTSDPGGPGADVIDPGPADPGSSDPGATPDPGPFDPGTYDPGAYDPGTPDPGTTDPGVVTPDEGGDTTVPPEDEGVPGDEGAPTDLATDVPVDDVPALDAGPDVAAPGAFWLTILHSSDTESAMLAGSDGFGGVAYFATLVKNLKADATAWQPPAEDGTTVSTGTLVMSAGDNFLAGLNFKASQEHGVPFFETMVLDQLGYDVVTLGNHDFDFGPGVLADFIGGFTGPTAFVSANLDVSAEPALQTLAGSGRLAKSVVVQAGGRPVGVIGAVTEELPFLSMVGAVEVGDAAAAIQAEVTKLTEDGVDAIVLLSHAQAVARDRELVPLLRGVDVVVSGGGHEIPAGPGAVLIPSDKTSGTYAEKVADADGVEVPIVAAGSLYRYVGRLVVRFDATGRVTAVDESRSGPIRVASGDVPDAVEADSTIDNGVVVPLQDAAEVKKANVIGLSDVALDGLRTNVRTRETNAGDLVADALLWKARQLAAAAGAAQPVVGLQNGGGIRNNSVLLPGDITEYDTFTMLPFSNHVAIVPDVPRATFKDLLENAVSRVEAVDGRFLQVAGVRFTWDGSRPARVVDVGGTLVEAGSRVRTATLDDGTEIVTDGAVVPGPALAVATIDYEANGGDQSPYGGLPFSIVDATYQEALQDYIVTALGGVIVSQDYPEGGTGRISALNACGNGIVEGSEACDDGNAAAGDGCAPACAVEAGYTCKGSPSVCKAAVCEPGVVISQVYGGGGNKNGLYTNDFVELHNRSKTAADVSGWSIQYASAAGTYWKANVLPASTTIPGGGYLLVRFAGFAGNGQPLPEPSVDLSKGSNFSMYGGKVALVAGTAALSGCPAAGAFVDLVAYGPATCGEGDSPAGELSAAKAALRNGGGVFPGTGCDDTNDNAADFAVGAPMPRTASSAPVTCGCD